MSLGTLPSSVRDRIEVTPDGCWRWLGWITTQGYGQLRRKQAHRVIYELLVGSIPEDRQLDHLCRNRWCVNPDHVEPVSHHENLLRGWTPSMNREWCKAGLHDITYPGAIYVDSDGRHRCRQCRIASRRRHRAKAAL